MKDVIFTHFADKHWNFISSASSPFHELKNIPTHILLSCVTKNLLTYLYLLTVVFMKTYFSVTDLEKLSIVEDLPEVPPKNFDKVAF